jgi:homoserine kinase
MPVRFVEHTVCVTVPATSANLGPGYDSFGLALSRYDEVTARVMDAGLRITVTGEGSGTVSRDESHLVVRAMRATFERLGGQPTGLAVECDNRIPHGRGLGSSAAAIVSGVQAARCLVVDGTQILDDAATLALASELEGHPDNVAACLLGGATVAWSEGSTGRATRIEPSGFRPLLFVPTGQSATEAARAALPTTVPHADAAFNLSRAALLAIAIRGRPDLLLTATEDRLHQNYRSAGMADSYQLVTELRRSGIPAVISGAGPTVLAMTTSAEQLEQARTAAPEGWECTDLDVAEGAITRIL